MEKEQQPKTSSPKDSISNKKWVSVLILIINGLVIGFCFFALTPLLYFFSETSISMETVTAIFSIDWTVFGIFIAVAGMMIAIKQNKKIKTIDRFVKTELSIIVINSLVSCVMLFIASFFVFTGNEKLFMASTFSTLYLLSLVFVNCIFLLAAFVADEWIFKD